MYYSASFGHFQVWIQTNHFLVQNHQNVSKLKERPQNSDAINKIFIAKPKKKSEMVKVTLKYIPLWKMMMHEKFKGIQDFSDFSDPTFCINQSIDTAVN